MFCCAFAGCSEISPHWQRSACRALLPVQIPAQRPCQCSAYRLLCSAGDICHHGGHIALCGGSSATELAVKIIRSEEVHHFLHQQGIDVILLLAFSHVTRCTVIPRCSALT